VNRREGALWVLGLLVAVGVVHALSFSGAGPVDDDFIAFRYARNLAEGHGLVFNEGLRVEGFSAPLWVLAIAAGLKLGFPATVLGSVLSVLGGAASILSVGLVWRRYRPAAQWFAPAALLAVSPAFAWHTAAGLGTVLLAGLLAGWLALYDSAEREGRAALGAACVLGLACLLRAEALVWALPFVVVELRRGKGTASLLALLPAAAWLAFRLSYYGRPLPMTYYVKHLPLAAELTYGTTYLGLATLSCGIGVLLIAALPLALPVARRGAGSRALSVALFGLFAHAGYVVWVGGDFMPLGRFFMPALPIACLAACLGLTRLWSSRPQLVAAVGLVAALAFQWPQWIDRAPLHARHQDFEERWLTLGRELAQRVPPNTSVALSPIGAFGYASRLPIVDILGLVNGATEHSEPDLVIIEKGHHRYDAEWVLAEQPDLVILGNAWLESSPDGALPTLTISAWERTLWEHPEFQEQYRPFALELEQTFPLVFYLRRGAPIPRGARPL